MVADHQGGGHEGGLSAIAATNDPASDAASRAETAAFDMPVYSEVARPERFERPTPRFVVRVRVSPERVVECAQARTIPQDSLPFLLYPIQVPSFDNRSIYLPRSGSILRKT